MGRPAPSTQAGGRRRRGQQGGAISLWVVLMVPVAAFAAVVAMAGPQRMAAESSMEEAAADLATLAVTLRDGRADVVNIQRNQQEGTIEGFLPDCPEIQIPATVIQGTPEYLRYETQQTALQDVCGLLLGDDTGGGEAYLHRDLGSLGVNTVSWEGFYSDSILKTGPCLLSTAVKSAETRDAVYVALAADWEDGGWAAAQAWPDGVRFGDELVARLNQEHSDSTTTSCDPDDFTPPPKSEPPRTAFD